MNKFTNKKSAIKNKKSFTMDALRIVREFQRKYRRTIQDKGDLNYTWEANPNSVGELKQKSYLEDSRLIL